MCSICERRLSARRGGMSRRGDAPLVSPEYWRRCTIHTGFGASWIVGKGLTYSSGLNPLTTRHLGRHLFLCRRGENARRPNRSRSGFVRRAGASIYSVINAVACRNQTCALRAPTAFSARINGIRAENAVMVNHKDSVGFLYEIAESARMVFIRADSAIRADGFSSAQYRRSARTAGAI